MRIANAQTTGPFSVYLPAVIKGGNGPLAPTPTFTATATLIHTPTATPTPTSVPQTTFLRLYPVQNAYVGERAPNTNFGRSYTLFVGTYEGEGNGLIQFDLSTIPTGTQITSAILGVDYEMRQGSTSQTPTFIVTAYRTSAPWDELLVTWNSRPSRTEDYDTIGFNLFGFKTFDITNLVQAWVNGTYPNYGITLAGSANYSNTAAGFCPREGGTWGCNGSSGSPTLSITYVKP